MEWMTIEGSAGEGSDYLHEWGKVVFAAGATSATITLTLLGDGALEPDEMLTIALSRPLGLTFDDGKARVTIVDDDGPQVVTVTAVSPFAAEAGPVAATFTVARGTNVSNALDVALAWGGSATAIADYVLSVSGGTLSADGMTLTIAAGARSATITVTPAADGVSPEAETVVLTALLGGEYALGATTTASAQIADQPLTLSVADATASESGGQLVVTVTLSQAAAGLVTVIVATQASGSGAGFAQPAADYQSETATLTFAAGETSKSFTVTILGDAAAEGPETFELVLSAASGGATIARGTATATILDAVMPAPAAPAGAAPRSVQRQDPQSAASPGPAPAASPASAPAPVAQAVVSAPVVAAVPAAAPVAARAAVAPGLSKLAGHRLARAARAMKQRLAAAVRRLSGHVRPSKHVRGRPGCQSGPHHAARPCHRRARSARS